MKILLVLLLALISPLFAQEAGWPFIRNYTPKEYGSDPQVWSILQDKNTDIMYYGTNPGIVSYDGVRWRVIPMPNNRAVRALHQAEDGTIYAGLPDNFGFLTNSATGETRYQSLVGSLPDSTLKLGSVWSVKTDNRYVYFLSQEYLMRYAIKTGKIQVFEPGVDFRFGIVIQNTDGYHVRIPKKGLMKIEENAMRLVADDFLLKNISRQALRYDDSTFMMSTSENSLFLYKPAKGGSSQRFAFADSVFLQENRIYRIEKIAGEDFIIGSQQKGALVFDKYGQTLRRLWDGNGLIDNKVSAVFGREGQPLWLGTDNGIAKTPQNDAWAFRDTRAGFKGAVAGIRRFKNRLYAASSLYIYHIDSLPIQVQGIPVGQNWEMIEHKGSLLAGTQRGVYQIDGDVSKPIYSGQSAYVLYISRKNPDRIFTTHGSQSFISLLYKNGAWESEGIWKGINDNIRYLAEDGDGILWLGTRSNGIIRVVPGKESPNSPSEAKYYGKKDGLPVANDCNPFWYEGKLLVGTEKGMYEYDAKADKFVPYCGWGNNFCDGTQAVYFFQKTESGRVYVGAKSNMGSDIGYIIPNGKGAYEWVYKPFRRLPEIAGLGGIWAEENGMLWIGGSEGLFRYDEKADKTDYGQAFKCWVREVLLGGDSAVYHGGGSFHADTKPQALPRFEYARNSLKFLFAAPFFEEEQRTLYSYKLEGYDEDWSPWSPLTHKEYNNLHEGAYTFMAKAKNLYGTESSIDSYTFEIKTPWYRSWWAFMLYAGFLGLMVFGIVKYNARRLVLQQLVLEDLIKTRTAEVVMQKEELQQKNEEINQQAEELKSTLEFVEIERGKSDKLLLNILPKETADELKNKGFATTKRYDKVSVLFTDFKGFTQISEKMSPEEVVQNLDYCFRAFDKICKKHGLEKIKTIGDAYMAAGGIPTADGDNPERAVAAALEMRDFIKRWKNEKESLGEKAWEVRIGIHTGPVVAGVVGEDKFAYDIWGDTVNTASRMESSGEPGQVNISEATRDAIIGKQFIEPAISATSNPDCSKGQPITKWSFEFRGKLEVKGKGQMGMFFVTEV